MPSLLRTLLKEAGGPQAVYSKIERKRRKEAASVQVERLRRKGHRSVLLDPDEQVSLAEACAENAAMLIRTGRRSYDPSTRALRLKPRPRARDQTKIRLERSGGLIW